MSATGVCREEGRRQKRDLLLMRRHPASQIAADLLAWISKRICPMDTLGRNKRVLSGEGRDRGRERGLWLPPGPLSVLQDGQNWCLGTEDTRAPVEAPL